MTVTTSKPSEARTFGDVMRAFRERADISHRDIAGKCGVSRAEVKAWERGIAYPTSGRQTRALCDMMPQLKHYLLLLPAEQRIAARTEMGIPTAPVHRSDAIPIETAMPSSDFLPPPLAPPSTFGEALRRARIHEGMNQEEVGELVGVVVSTISDWERDEHAPVVDNYTKLVEIFSALKDAPRPDSLDRDKPVGNVFGTGGAKPGTGIVPDCVVCRDNSAPGPHTCVRDSGRLPSIVETPTAMVDRMGIDYARALMIVGSETAKVARLESELRTAKAAVEMASKECDRVLKRLADAANCRLEGKFMTPK